MSLDTIHADGIEEGLQRWAANPGPDPGQSFSVTGFLGAGAKALPAAALDIGGAAADFLSGFATPLAASGGSAGGMFSIPTPDEQKQQEAARQQMLQGGSFDTAGGNVARRKADSFSPDPLTSHAADQVLHGLVRFGAKAVGAVGTMGPLGAVPLAAEEAENATQRLRAQGVDTGTAVKVGAVEGVMAGAGAVMPLGGKTVLQTLGLVAAGGPGSFMAQEALSKKILQAAGYADQASLHNPFDPLGLAVSTVVPGLFGAVHMRGVQRSALEKVVEHIESGGQRYGKDGQLLTSPKGAQGEMQVMPGTATDPGFGVTPAQNSSPEELARVGRDYLGAMATRYGDNDKALAAYNAGPGAVDKAIAAHGDDWLKHLPRETQEYVHKANALGARHVAEVAAQDPANVDAARVATTNDAMVRSLPDTPDAVEQVHRAADIVAEDGGRAAEQMIPPVRTTDLPTFREWFGESKVVDEKGEPLVVYHGTMTPGFDTFKRGEVQPIGGVRFADAQGFYFTDHPGYASDYGDTVMPVYLSIKKPYIVAADQYDHTYVSAARRAELEAQGYDGIIAPEVKGGRFGEIVPFRPEQIKSATGNSGKFDPNSPSLTDPLRPGERSPRESNNALPPHDSITLAGDEPAARGEELGSAQREASSQKADAAKPPAAKDPEAQARDLELLQKRRTTLQTLLDCLEAA